MSSHLSAGDGLFSTLEILFLFLGKNFVKVLIPFMGLDENGFQLFSYTKIKLYSVVNSVIFTETKVFPDCFCKML